MAEEEDLLSVLGDTNVKDADRPPVTMATPRRVRPRPTKLLVCMCFVLSLAIEHDLPVCIFALCICVSGPCGKTTQDRDLIYPEEFVHWAVYVTPRNADLSGDVLDIQVPMGPALSPSVV
jgi:hypothetical protein